MSRPGKKDFSKSFRMLKNEIASLKPEEREKIEKAKLILIKSRGIGDMEAYALLIASSLELHKKLIELAQAVVQGYEIFCEAGYIKEMHRN